MKEEKGTSENQQQQSFVAIGLALGLVFGSGLGIVIDNIAIGAGLGLLIGILAGGILQNLSTDTKA